MTNTDNTSDIERLAFLKEQISIRFGQEHMNSIGFAASDEAGQLAGDCIGFDPNKERSKPNPVLYKKSLNWNQKVLREKEQGK